MSIKEFTDYVTLAGAVIAAGAGVWNLVIQMRGKRDQFFVRLGSLSPTIEEETMLSVVSRSDHPIRLTDWGFIEANGTFTSFIMEWEIGAFHGEEIVSRGSAAFESFGQHFETGYVRRDRPLGAYAVSATQRSPVITFDAKMPIWRRGWIRLRLLFQPSYLSWW
jgi:hypothetical protein